MEERRGRGRRLLGGLLLTAGMVVMAVSAVYFALDDHANRRSATQWRSRSIALRHVLDARTIQLKQRTHALTVASGQLGSLGGQVGTLDQRTRQLAADKAQVEDQKALQQALADALHKVAQEQTDCSGALSQEIPHIASSDAAWLTTNGPAIDSTCQQAQKDLASFNAKYG